MSAHPGGREVLVVSLRPLACWECGFESHRFMDPSYRGVLPFVCVSVGVVRYKNNFLHHEEVSRRSQNKKKV